MKKATLVMSLIAVSMLIAVVACNTNSAAPAADAQLSPDSLVKLGSHLVTTIGCDDCHTPKKMGAHGPEPDMDKRFAGHLANSPLGKIDTSVMKQGWVLFSMDLTAAVGPWGLTFASNISSDNTGIGNWSEDQFIKALRHGKYKGLEESRPLLPPMPWQNFAKLKDHELKAIFAFLKTTKPMENRVPEWKPLAELK